MSPIYIADEAGNIVDLSKLFDRVAQLEKRVPVFEIPKVRRKKKSQRAKQIEKQLLNSYK